MADTESNIQPTRQGFPILLTVVLSVVVFFMAATVIRGRGGGDTPPIVTSNVQYNDLLDEVEKETEDILRKADDEIPLTEGELKVLKNAESKVIGLINFDQSRYAIYLLAAKVAFAEGLMESAIQNCTFFYERGPSEGTAEVLVAVAETRYVCSRANFRLRKFNEAIAEAKEAVKVCPTDSRYHWALASAYAEIGQTEEAIKAIHVGMLYSGSSDRLLALKNFLTKPPEKDKPTS